MTRESIVGFAKEVIGYMLLISILDFLFTKFFVFSFVKQTILEVFFAVVLMFAIQEVIRRFRK